MHMTLRTALSDLLGIEYPIVQSGMGSVAGPELAGEVSKAGGLGVLGGLLKTGEQLRDEIRRVRALTNRPFGVNLWLHQELRPPVPAPRVADATVAAVQGALNAFRLRLGLPAVTARPAPPADLIAEAFQVILDERVPVWSTVFGPPDRPLIEECHRRGIKVIAMVAAVEDARTVVANGCDAVVAQGSEAGGHRATFAKAAAPETGAVGTIALVPQVADAVRVPVIAAGGIADGRGLVAALALGASGILMGTRFVATRESTAADIWKKALLERDGDATTVTDAFTGLWARALRNRFTEEYGASGAPVLPTLWQAAAARDISAAAMRAGNPDYFPMWSGQSVGLVQNLPGAAEVVETIVREAHAVLDALGSRARR
jgi:nitronate monooxygenase